MIYMEITNGELASKPKTHKLDFLDRNREVTLVPLRKCKNLKQAAKKATKLTCWNVKENELLTIIDIPKKTFKLIKVING